MDQPAALSPAPKPPSKRKAYKINRQVAVALAESGLSASEIARTEQVAPSTITRLLQHFHLDKDAVTQYKQHRPELLAWLQGKNLELQRQLLEKMEGLVDTVKPHQINGMIFALNSQHGTLFDKERLERGQSTANISMLSKLIDQTITTAHQRRKDTPQDVVLDSVHNDEISDEVNETK